MRYGTFGRFKNFGNQETKYCIFKEFLRLNGLREVSLFNITKMLAPKALLARQKVSEIKISSKHQEQTIFSTQFLAGSLTDAQKSRCMEDRREEGGGGGFF